MNDDQLAETLPRPIINTTHLGNPIDLSIIYVNWNSATLIEDSIASLISSGTTCNYEIIISDNASNEPEQEQLRSLVKQYTNSRCIFNQRNDGFGVGNNLALPLARGRYILFLNNDTIILESLDDLVNEAHKMEDSCGAIAGKVLNVDRSIQLTCRMNYTLPVIIASFTFAILGKRPSWVRKQELEDWDHASIRDVAMLSGCYLLVPRIVLDTVGAFDSKIFLFYEDADLCYRIRAAGYLVRYVPFSTIIHLEGGSRDPNKHASALSLGSSFASAQYFTRLHLGIWQAWVLATTVRLWWMSLWVVQSLASVIIPIPRIRLTLRRRTQLLGQLLSDIPLRRIPD